MNLKEGFRYQKFLNSIIEEATDTILDSDFYYTTTKTHHRAVANAEAEDEVEVVEKEKDYTINDVVKLLCFLVDQKNLLSCAIGAAKAQLTLDVDAAIETNKQRQWISKQLTALAKKKNMKIIERGQDYKFNNEGNQMPYYYNIDIDKTLAFDKTFIKDIAKKMITTADCYSQEIDQALVNTEIDFDPVFNINDSYEDVIMDFIE